MSAVGMNCSTGARLDDLAHIRQSIRDILTTRIGTRLMRREYGSLVPELIDQPGNQSTRLRLMAATVMAIIRWEPRVLITKVSYSIDMAGTAVLDMEGERRDGPRADKSFSFSIPVK